MVARPPFPFPRMRRRIPRIALITAVGVLALGGLAFAAVQTGALGAHGAKAKKAAKIKVRLTPARLKLTPGKSAKVRIAISGRRWPKTGGVRASAAALGATAAAPARGKVRLSVTRPLRAGLSVRFAHTVTANRRGQLSIRAASGMRPGTYRLRITATRVRPRGAPKRRAQRASTLLTFVVPSSGGTTGAGGVTPGASVPAATPAPTTPAVAPTPATGPKLLVGGNLHASLAPGHSESLDAKLANPFDADVDVTSIDIAIVDVNAPNATPALPCDLNDFAVRSYQGPPIRLPKGSVRSLEEIGVPRDRWPVLTMLDRPVNQDGCKGAAITFSYAASARSVDP